ncbi:ATPase [Candidatus Fermentibacteria bacterium]|nr:ATPase [Candidatus Fermentibacteria bacterium]
MRNRNDLAQKLEGIDSRGYKAYKSIKGSYDLGDMVLHIDHVQSDPFAPPSHLRAVVPQSVARIPPELFSNPSRRIGLEDYLTRRFHSSARRHEDRRGGTGKSGLLSIDRCGSEILRRTSMVVGEDFVEARFVVGLPARGRRVMAAKAKRMLLESVPEVASEALHYRSIDADEVEDHVQTTENQDLLRSQLEGLELVSFVANGSILPRESGVSDLPLEASRAVPFQSPPELEVSLTLKDGSQISGMGVPEGVSLVVGGGYHGKSTLLRAVQKGVYNHVPGDGREMVVTVDSAMKVRAEDGRSVVSVDIHPFIADLPQKIDTRCFTSENASGSTSQASNIVEALESGSRLLLLDEDTSATNFMIRDVRMQHLVEKSLEPITPFIDRVRELHSVLGVSTMLVLGGSGDYLDIADVVVKMVSYVPRDATSTAREVADRFRSDRRAEVTQPMREVSPRVPLPSSFRLGRRDKVRPKGLHHVRYGRSTIDLSLVEQLVSSSQTNAIAMILTYMAKRYMDGSRSLSEAVDSVLEDVRKNGLDAISPFRGGHPGELALPRKQEICAAVNRYRRLEARQLQP